MIFFCSKNNEKTVNAGEGLAKRAGLHLWPYRTLLQSG